MNRIIDISLFDNICSDDGDNSISALKEKIQNLAFYDTVTGLPNRNSLINSINQEITGYTSADMLGALLIIDIDDSRKYNDLYGYSFGDELLRTASSKIIDALRHSDIAARIEGDEFAVFASDIKDLRAIKNLAYRILVSFKELMNIMNNDIYVTVSIGIATCQKNDDVKEIIRNAESALFKAKELGKNQFYLYEAGLNVKLQQRVYIETGLRRSLDTGGFEVYYQPIVQAYTGKVSAVEALMRWNHPVKGIVSPAEFIPVAEDSGLIVPMGMNILAKICRHSDLWTKAGKFPVPVAVNISPVQLRSPDFADGILRIIEASGIDPSLIEIEITESALLHSVSSVICIMKVLRSHGIQISLDDFGTGYSSLSLLKNLPFDKIKIDQSFTADIGINNHSEAIIHALVTLAHRMGIKLIAEGVETAEQNNFLTEIGCDFLQGYLYSKPIPAADIENIFEDKNITHVSDSYYFYQV